MESLVSLGVLDGGFRIPNAVGPVTVTADLRARVSASVDIDAPPEGRLQTLINWLVRQLKDAPETLRVGCFARHARGASASELLRDVRANPAMLIDDLKRDLRVPADGVGTDGRQAWPGEGELRGRGAGAPRRFLRVDRADHQAVGGCTTKASVANNLHPETRKMCLRRWCRPRCPHRMGRSSRRSRTGERALPAVGEHSNVSVGDGDVDEPVSAPKVQPVGTAEPHDH